MRYLKVVLSLCIILLVSCQKVNKTPKPKNLIPEDEMVDVLVDLAKVSAAMSLNASEFEKREVEAKKLIFEKYSIDSAQLIQSTAYYAERYNKNERIYEAVTEQLQKETDSLYDLEKEEREKKNKAKIKENKEAAGG